MNQICQKILIVDDEPDIRDLLSRWLVAEGYDCITAPDGNFALKSLTEGGVQLVLTDIMMPGMSGVDLLTVTKTLFQDVAVVMVTAVDDKDTGEMALDLGAFGYITKPFDRNNILITVKNALERRRLNVLSREYQETLEKEVLKRTTEVREREEEIIFRLLSATGHRHTETGSHVRRIGSYASVIARALGWSLKESADIRLAAPMHDVGKIGIPDAILLKPGPLTPDEFEVVKGHTLIGAQILNRSAVPLLRMASEIALSHHERYAGGGYPRGLVGDAIPESARIVSVVDVYDALVHDRVYRSAFSEKEAVSMMIVTQEKGQYFDTRVFNCFLDLLPQMRHIREEFMDVSSEIQVS